MQNKIVIGVANTLRTLGGKYKVYTSDVKQDLSVPCFLVRTVSAPAIPGISNRKEVTTTISITYWPETDDEDELRSMMDSTTNLYDLIEVDPGVFLRGYHQDVNISDGCLVCTVDYKSSVVIPNASESMESMLKKGMVK
jgi:hypothetical protein